MNITEKLSNLLFLQGRLEENLKNQILCITHNMGEFNKATAFTKLLENQQANLEKEVSTLKQEIESLKTKD